MSQNKLEYTKNDEVERIRKVLLEFTKTHNDNLLKEFGDDLLDDLKQLLLQKESLYKVFAELLYNDLHKRN